MTTLANRRGLIPNIQTTTTLVNTYYGGEATEVSNQETEWQLMSFLAKKENFDLWVDGLTLNFQPKVDIDTVTPYIISYDGTGSVPVSNTEKLTLERTLTLARDVIVKVNSWDHQFKRHNSAGRKKIHYENVGDSEADETTNTKKAKTPTSTVRAPASPKFSKNTPQVYEFRAPGLSQAQVNALAEQKLAELSAHERNVQLTLPCDPSITIRTILKVTGTNTDFDQSYYVDEITYHCGFEHGYQMTVNAKNSSPNQVITINGTLTTAEPEVD
jgi:hypothetical protein